MNIKHDSRDTKYRTPYGAVTCGTEITLRLSIGDVRPSNVRLVLRREGDPEPRFIDMKEESGDNDTYIYTAEIHAPESAGLLWYYFAIEGGSDDDRFNFYYGNETDRLGGEGKISHTEPDPYQITVYREAVVPDWYKHGIVYQIFPDRFARDEDWKERVEASVSKINSRSGGEKRVLEEDWNRKAYYVRDEKGRVTEWPIYGGSFKGIEDKLDYLKSLGVTAIYLNPIFESTSNHHYDTADYMKPDSSFGTEEDFASLAAAAKSVGIRLILDGVFSHTGADSKYFDRYGNYGGGAYSDEDSPYRSWYKFDENEPCGYKSWWGVDDLPEVNEEDPGFRELITGEQGVIDHWMKLGASGWRLDVADELPDSFIKAIRERVKADDPDGLLIGEVWEDASNKISYGERRRYFMGDELDGVMNYPLRAALLDYVNYTISSGQAGRLLKSLEENYPPENFAGGLNLIGSHDRERILTAMAAAEDYKSAVKKVRLLSVLEYTLPGVPCIYYGDEAGLLGGSDPENRSGYPWGYENLDLKYHYRMLGLAYAEHPVLRDGDFTMLSGRYGISDDVLAFMRSGGKTDKSGEKIIVLANRSYGPTEVDLREVSEAGGGYAFDLLTSKDVKVNAGGIPEVIRMAPLSCMMICILDETPRREKHDRAAGVICHISSLGKGVLGKPARDFVDYLASAGMKIWQVLPLNPAGLGGSPYSSRAAFAGNTLFINRDEIPDSSGYEEFCRKNMKWLTEYAAYTVTREVMGGKPWNEWPPEFRDATPEQAIQKLIPEHEARINELVKEQYWFDVQWRELREYAASKGIKIMGDLPIYMAEDSADVWANKEVFRLDENGRLKVHAGVPPDAFSTEGQDWGNPLYDWERLKEDGYAWWMRRLLQCAERYDILRLDHFRGMSEYYAIPYGHKPVDGMWQHGPGMDFFRKIRETLEGIGLRLLAEDLGFLDPGVKNLLRLSGLPGMDIWQFTSKEMLEMPEEVASRRAFYSGTHDNDTIMGYVRAQLLSKAAKADSKADADTGKEAVKEADEEELETEAEIEALKIFRQLFESPAALAMIQLQDMFLLGSEARMNVPGVAEGNWGWKIPGDNINEAFEDASERAA